MMCDKWLHVYGNKLGTGVNCEWVDDVRENVKASLVIAGYKRDGSTQWFECSVCGGSVDFTDNFCKHCGAYFKGVDHGKI